MARASRADRDALQLEMAAAQQRSGPDEAPRRELLAEVTAVGRVEAVVEGEVGAEDLDGDQVVHSEPGLRQDRLHPVEEQADLLVEVRRRLPRFRVHSDAAREVD